MVRLLAVRQSAPETGAERFHALRTVRDLGSTPRDIVDGGYV